MYQYNFVFSNKSMENVVHLFFLMHSCFSPGLNASFACICVPINLFISLHQDFIKVVRITHFNFSTTIIAILTEVRTSFSSFNYIFCLQIEMQFLTNHKICSLFQTYIFPLICSHERPLSTKKETCQVNNSATIRFCH